jgi:riboflavin kinase / FMN adenylyltransferase
MKVIDENLSLNFDFETYIALGSFDGLHLGHMSLVNKAIELAKEDGCKSMVYTFKNHPLTVVNKDISPKLLMDNDTKVDILRECGVDVTCLVEFNKEFMKMSPENFVFQIKTRYNMRGVIVGFNYRFGYKNEGDVALLKALGEKYDFKVHVMEALTYNGEVVSSSKIRRLIQDGDVMHANEVLTKPFCIRGKVTPGRKIGRELGFPTANIPVEDNLIYPKVGVYYTNVFVENSLYKGITNIGFNPTVNGTALSFETCILDFNDDIYGKSISVYFIERVRDEIRFESKQQLIEQMKRDKEYAENKKVELNIKK